jgi:hypoxanthine phosphoribosyltransferase
VETEAEFEVSTWSQIYAMLLSQAEKIRRGGFKPDVIVGLARGGWILARVLSGFLEIPDLAVVRVEFYLSVVETRYELVLAHGFSAVVEKHRNKKVVKAKAAKLVKAGLPKQLVKEFLKKEFEAGNC